MNPATSQTLAEFARDVWDVVVVGAGPAGSMAAHALAHQGLGVLLVDRAVFPRWKVCGCCLNPFTLNILETAGLGGMASGNHAAPVGLMRLAAGTCRANVKLSGWRVLSRERLDLALIETAVAAGARFLPSTQVGLGPELPDRRMVALTRGSEQVEVDARLIVAADGLGSRLLLSEPGAKIHAAPSSRVGVGAVAETRSPFYEPGVIHMAYGRGGYVGLVRLEDGRLNIAAALDVDFLQKSHSPGRAVEQLLSETGWPAIDNMADLAWQGTPTLTRRAARPAAARVFAVGDSSGYIEPFTGEGIGWAMASGVAVVPLAARAVREWQPALADEWTALENRTKASTGQLCRAITWVSRRPLLARGLIGLVGRAPWLAGPLVNRIGAIPSEPPT